jgi:hypothetical protein
VVDLADKLVLGVVTGVAYERFLMRWVPAGG